MIATLLMLVGAAVIASTLIGVGVYLAQLWRAGRWERSGNTPLIVAEHKRLMRDWLVQIQRQPTPTEMLDKSEELWRLARSTVLSRDAVEQAVADESGQERIIHW